MTATKTAIAPERAYRRARTTSTAYAGWLNGQPHVAYVQRSHSRVVIAGPIVCDTRGQAIEVAHQLQDDIAR
jgi:hypothetical protein